MSTIICPNCGAQVLRPPLNSDELVCANCGAKININVNYNFNYSKSENTKHIVDDAKIQSAENRNRVIGIFATPFEEYRARKEHKHDYCMEQARERTAKNVGDLTKFVARTDKFRGDYYRYHTGHEWNDARNYDLCLDSSKLGFDGCVEAIEKYIEVRFK